LCIFGEWVLVSRTVLSPNPPAISGSILKYLIAVIRLVE